MSAKAKATPRGRAAGRRKVENENVRTLTKAGGGKTYTVSIPASTIRGFRWKEHQKVVVTADPKTKTITVRDWN